MTSILSAIFGFFGGIWDFAAKVLDYIKERSLITIGRALEQGDIAKKEVEATNRASEILSQEVTKEQTVDKLKNGSF